MSRLASFLNVFIIIILETAHIFVFFHDGIKYFNLQNLI